MDKNNAIKISKLYLNKLQKSRIEVLEAWLFGSYAKGTFGANSDIDVALVLPDSALSFDTEVQLMTLRNGEETLIEPHLYGMSDFQTSSPMVEQIKRHGMKLAV